MALPDDADCARDCPPGPSSNGVEKNPREDRAGGATTPKLLRELDRAADSSRPLLPTLPPTSEPSETTERRRRDSKIERKKRRKGKKRDERRALREASAKRSDEGHEPPPLGPRGREWRPAIEPGGEACRDAAGACRLSLVPPAHWVERGSRRATWAEGSREGRREKASSRGDSC